MANVFNLNQFKKEPVVLVKKEVKSGITLTEHQSLIYDTLLPFSMGALSYKMLLLEGYAGTGKSTIVNHLIAALLSDTGKVIGVTAPTNKAVKVLRKMSKYLPTFSERLQYKTIHSLLGLKEVIGNDGKKRYVADKLTKKSIDQIDFLILDEASMLQDELFEEIQLYVMGGLRVLFVGDGKQIPPVMQDEATPFNEENRRILKIEHLVLSEIVRQAAGNPIIQMATAIREHPTYRKSFLSFLPEDPVTDSGDGVYPVHDMDFFVRVCNKLYLSAAYKTDSDYVKIVCWTNREVDKLNNYIRTLLYPEQCSDRIVIGERLLAEETIIDRTEGLERLQYTTNDEFEVLSYTISHVVIVGVNYKIYNCVVASSGEERENIRVLHEDSQEDYDKVLARFKELAVNDRSGKAAPLWANFYNFQTNFAKIKYNYAITAHKSQGSTYTNCIVLVDDVCKNSYLIERNKILYTAITRASRRLFMVEIPISFSRKNLR